MEGSYSIDRLQKREKNAGNEPNKNIEGESEVVTVDLSELSDMGTLGQRKKMSTCCKSSLWASPFLCLYPSVLHAGPCPGSLGKCQAVDWQRMKGCGQRAGGQGEAGAEERMFLRFSHTIFDLHF